MLYQMTQDDIDNGEPGNSYHCPLVNMFKRYGRRVRVSTKILDLDTKRSCEIPDEAEHFMLKFDSFRPVEPISLELDF